MKTRIPSVLLSLLLAPDLLVPAAFAVSDPAVHHEISRYEPIWKFSPFVVVTDLSGKADDLAGRYVLTGFARMGDKDVAFVFDRTSLERFTLVPGEAKNGLTLDSVHHQGNLSTLRAKISTAGRTLEIAYDASASPVAATPAQPGNQPPRGRNTPPQQPNRQPAPNTQARNQPTPQRQNPNPQPTPKPQPGLPNQTAQPPQNMNQIVGNNPTPNQTPPPPRRVIRRRGIVAPQ